MPDMSLHSETLVTVSTCVKHMEAVPAFIEGGINMFQLLSTKYIQKACHAGDLTALYKY